jgi:hypothetical protein
MTTTSKDDTRPIVKQPRHINIAMSHMLKQRERAIAVRDKAADEVKKLDEALLALGWGEES